MTLTVDLQNQGQVDYCMTFFIFGCIYDIDLDLCVDSIVFDAKDLAFIKILSLDLKEWPWKSRSEILFVTPCSSWVVYVI